MAEGSPPTIRGSTRPVARLLVATALTGAAACGDARPGEWMEEDGYRWRELSRASGAAGGGYSRLDAAARGIDFVYAVSVEDRTSNRILAEGQGAAVGDVNGDGLADIVLAGFQQPVRLYINQGDWRFSKAPGGALPEVAMARGVTLADANGDGHLDMFLAVHGAPNRLLSGDGTGSFTDGGPLGSHSRGSVTFAVADIDSDGDLDAYASNYKTARVDDQFPPEMLDIGLVTRDGDTVSVPERLQEVYDQHYRIEFDGRFVRRFELGEADELYINQGGGMFRAVDPLEVLEGEPLSGDPAWGLAAKFADWNGDGNADLYVANDFATPDRIWLGRGDGSFEEAPWQAVRTTSLSSMAVAVADLDRDGHVDLLTTDMLAREPDERRTQTHGFEALPDPPGQIRERVQVNRNTLQLNRGDGTFSEAAYQMGLPASGWSWAALALDADLDGWQDILIATGHLWNQLDGDASARISQIPNPPARQALAMLPALRQENVAFLGGPGGFRPAAPEWGWGGEEDITHGLAAGDLDQDGDLDMIATRFGEPPVLYRNESSSPRILVRLAGRPPNTRGIGARITLTGPDSVVQVRLISAGGDYLSSSDPVASLAGLAEESRLRVIWPGGAVTELGGIRANREYELHQPPPGPTLPAGSNSHLDSRSPPADPWFEDVSAHLGHVHTDTTHHRRSLQPLLPLALDRLGPGVTWADPDSDGDADLVVGAGAGGVVVMIPNRHGEPAGGGFGAEIPLTEVLDVDAATLLPLPRDGAGEPGFPVRFGAGLTMGIGSRETGGVSAGPMSAADIDLDGVLDLFVGGREMPGHYPRAADSYILRSGSRPDPRLSEPFRSLGLVSGSLFTDIDLDGDPDLALALEWGPPTVFLNDGAGGFTDATERLGLAGLSGRWNGIAAADFNGDGRQDLALSAWGNNLDLPSTYSVVHGDFNRDGVWDVVEVDPGGYPLRGRDALVRPWPLGEAGPGLPELVTVSYADFAARPLAQSLPAAASAQRLTASTLLHTVLLAETGQGGELRFRAVPLPAGAQRSPAFGIAAADLDGDGNEDLLLAQNYYGGRPGTPRYDGGRSLWLRGDGRGNFEAVENAGIAVYGDARAVALADYGQDGRVDVAIGVNGGATRLYRNLRARPGLRVSPPVRPGAAALAVGTRLRVIYDDGRLGPAREIRMGEGYRAVNEVAQTLGLGGGVPAALQVTWPGGVVDTLTVTPGQPELVLPEPPG